MQCFPVLAVVEFDLFVTSFSKASMLKFIETKQETLIVPTDEHLSKKLTNFLRAYCSSKQLKKMPFVLKYST